MIGKLQTEVCRGPWAAVVTNGTRSWTSVSAVDTCSMRVRRCWSRSRRALVPGAGRCGHRSFQIKDDCGASHQSGAPRRRRCPWGLVTLGCSYTCQGKAPRANGITPWYTEKTRGEQVSVDAQELSYLLPQSAPKAQTAPPTFDLTPRSSGWHWLQVL